jgi:fermentation-respiration switch protein FrsA (DUF1100 family)
MIKFIFSAIMIFIVGLIAGGIYFYNYSILRKDKDILKDNPDLDNPSGKDLNDKISWLQYQNVEKLKITSKDGLILLGQYISAKNPTKKTAILVHGYNGRGSDMAHFAEYYSEELGFNVFMPDCRGHGESGGKYIGFGWHDRKDILDWIAIIIKRLGKDSEILLHGISMGGATVLMASGENLPDNVKCIISDCAYSSIKGILTYQMKKMFKLPQFPLIHVTSLICKLRAGYLFREGSSIEQVRKTKKPILFIHGSEDKFVPTDMVNHIYEVCKAEKELLIIEGAIHGNAYWVDMKSYKRKVETFINKYI